MVVIKNKGAMAFDLRQINRWQRTHKVRNPARVRHRAANHVEAHDLVVLIQLAADACTIGAHAEPVAQKDVVSGLVLREVDDDVVAVWPPQGHSLRLHPNWQHISVVGYDNQVLPARAVGLSLGY